MKPLTCQCAVCGLRRADVAKLLGQFVCFDCLTEAAADAVDAGDLNEGTTLADGERYDIQTTDDVFAFVQAHHPESPQALNGAVRFGIPWTNRDGTAGTEWHRVTTIEEARAALGY